MFGSLGGSELLLILVLALLLFGPRRLPQIGRTIGRAMSEFRKATNELKSNLEQEVRTDEIGEVRSGIESLNRDLTEVADSVNPRRIVERAVGRVTGTDPVKPTKPEPAPRRPGAPATGGGAGSGVEGAPTAPAEKPPAPAEGDSTPTPATDDDERERSES